VTIKLADLEVLEILHRLHADVALTTDEAAVFLRLSPTTLERMRRDGTGPPYMQGGGKGSRGLNQKCTYSKADLLNWQRNNRVSNSMAAAVRKGQVSLYIPHVDPTPRRSKYDLVTKRAFYIDSTQWLWGALDDTDITTVIERIGNTHIVWLNPVAAAGRTWGSRSDFEVYAKGVLEALDHATRVTKRALKRQ